jgi:hypothetical protein
MARLALISVLLILAAAQAITRNSSPKGSADTRVCTQLYHPPVVKGTALLQCKLEKKTLHVKFLEGEQSVRDRVQQVATKWNSYSGVTLVFDDSPNADIRVAFEQGRGSSSCVGKCGCSIPQLIHSDATMNFGWLTPATSDQEYNRVVLHEFGHALGLVHEHQNPSGGIQWNRAAVYEYYVRSDGWNKDQVDHNIFETYSKDQTMYTTFDPSSIMLYAIPRELTTNGFAVGWNTELSEMDRAFIGQVYPK